MRSKVMIKKIWHAYLFCLFREEQVLEGTEAPRLMTDGVRQSAFLLGDVQRAPEVTKICVGAPCLDNYIVHLKTGAISKGSSAAPTAAQSFQCNNYYPTLPTYLLNLATSFKAQTFFFSLWIKNGMVKTIANFCYCAPLKRFFLTSC